MGDGSIIPQGSRGKSWMPVGDRAYLDPGSLPRGKDAVKGLLGGKDVMQMEGVEVAVIPSRDVAREDVAKSLSERRASKKLSPAEVAAREAAQEKVQRQAESAVATGIVVREMATKTAEELRESPEFEQALRTSLGGEQEEASGGWWGAVAGFYNAVAAAVEDATFAGYEDDYEEDGVDGERVVGSDEAIAVEEGDGEVVEASYGEQLYEMVFGLAQVGFEVAMDDGEELIEKKVLNKPFAVTTTTPAERAEREADIAAAEMEAERLIAQGIVVRYLGLEELSPDELRENPEFQRALREALGEAEGSVVDGAVWAVNEVLDFGYGFVRSFFDQQYVNDVTGYVPPDPADVGEVQEVFQEVYDVAGYVHANVVQPAAAYAHEHVISPYILEPAKREVERRGTEWLRNKAVELANMPDERTRYERVRDNLKILGSFLPAAMKGQKARETWLNNFLVTFFPPEVASLLKTERFDPDGNNLTAGLRYFCYGETAEDLEKTKVQRHMLGVFLTNYFGLDEEKWSDRIMDVAGKYFLGVDVKLAAEPEVEQKVKGQGFKRAGAIFGAVVPGRKDKKDS